MRGAAFQAAPQGEREGKNQQLLEKTFPAPQTPFLSPEGAGSTSARGEATGGLPKWHTVFPSLLFPSLPPCQPCLSGGLLVLLSSEGGRRCWAGALHVYQHVCFLCQGCTAWLRCQQKAFSERFLEGRCDEQFKAQADRINQARPVAALGRRWISPCGSDDIVLLNIPRFSHPQARFM